MANYTSIIGQSIFDVCLQTYGTLDLLYKLMQDNNIASVDVDLTGGTYFYFDEELTVDSGVNLIYKGTKERYCTDAGVNGNVFYVIDNSDGDNITPPTIKKFEVVSATTYTATIDGESSFAITDDNGLMISGADIVQVERETKPLKRSEWNWNKLTSVLTANGFTLYAGEQLAIIYTKTT